MKKKTFKKIIKNILELYKTGTQKDKEFEKIFGRDSTVISSWYNINIQEILKILAKDLKDKDDWIEYLFWENLAQNETHKFSSNKKKYKSTPSNIWKVLKGKI